MSLNDNDHQGLSFLFARSSLTGSDIALDRQKAGDQSCDEIKSQCIMDKEPLEPVHVRIPVNDCRHGRRHLMETDGLNHTKSMDDVCHQLY